MENIKILCERAKRASYAAATLSTTEKNSALLACADQLDAMAADILAANRVDMENARLNGIESGILDRLMLDDTRIADITAGIRKVALLPDPVGRVLDKFTRPNGLEITKITVPMGVVAMIYEARPNVTADAAALCFKAGNVCVLRTGKEAVHSGKAIADAMRLALTKSGINPDIICFVDNTSREAANALMRMNGYVDVLIPRGGAGLIRSVVENATVPIIETGTGNCHVYVDSPSDLQMGLDILVNGKTTRISVCNATESLLVHRDVASTFLPMVVQGLKPWNVEIYGCEQTQEYIPCLPATEADYGREYLDYKISIKVVDSVDEAISHINQYSTGHSDCIVTSDSTHAQRFVAGVDSSAVYVNASTRFTDGGEFGFGAEIGISTQKLHARGPMGLPDLCSYKYIVVGNGQIR